jgi:hypothetical protein
MTAVIGWSAGGVRAALPLAASLVASGAALAGWALLRRSFTSSSAMDKPPSKLEHKENNYVIGV